jgi:hypothetical protein
MLQNRPHPVSWEAMPAFIVAAHHKQHRQTLYPMSDATCTNGVLSVLSSPQAWVKYVNATG